MPRLQYNGEYYRLTNDIAESLRKELETLSGDDAVTLEVQDMDGDAAWLYIPFGAPVSIRYFD